MRGGTIAVLCLFLFGMAAPVLAVNEEKYGYITVQSVDINLVKDSAEIQINYTLDEPTRLLVLLLGKQDLKNRLLRVLNFEDAKVTYIEMDQARLQVDDVSYDYGRGIYWFPEHHFNVIIPSLTVRTPQLTREYTYTDNIPNGIGYFDS
jgi:hypothetical protein